MGPQPWRSVHEAGLKRTVNVRRAVLVLLRIAAHADFSKAVTIADAVTALSAAVNTKKDVVIRRLSSLYLRILADAGQATADFGIRRTLRTARQRKVAIEFEFDGISTANVTWAQQHAGELVTAITAEQLEVLRTFVINTLESGKSVKSLKRELQNVIGLTEPQARKFARVLETEGKTKAFAYARKAKIQRADVIARTEVMKASNQGQQMAWQQAKAAGVIDDTLVKEWITTYDDRTCPICRPMDGQQQPIDGSFVLPDGSTVLTPPAHPRCRCAHGLNAKSVRKAA